MEFPIPDRSTWLLQSAKGLAALAELADRSIYGPFQGTGAAIDNRRPHPEIADDVDLSDPVTLLQRSARAVSGWLWSPNAQRAANLAISSAAEYSALALEVSTSTGAAWWWDPLDRDAQILLVGHGEEPDLAAASRARSVTSRDPNSALPYGELLTTSRYLDQRLPAALLCDVEITSRLPNPISCWRITVDEGARVLEIRVPSDWAKLCERYPAIIETPSHWPRSEVDTKRAITADWKLVRQDWDAVHISMSAVLTATDKPILMGDRATMLEGFCSEVTVWLADILSSPELLATWVE